MAFSPSARTAKIMVDLRCSWTCLGAGAWPPRPCDPRDLPVMWVGLWLCEGSRPSVWVPMARMFCWMWAWAIISCCCRLLGCCSVCEPLMTGGLKCLEIRCRRQARTEQTKERKKERREGTREKRERENGGGNRAGRGHDGIFKNIPIVVAGQRPGGIHHLLVVLGAGCDMYDGSSTWA